MTSKHQRKISYTFKDYENDYESLWVEFLNRHEDFGIVYFIENEIKFYSMCYESSCITPIENTGSVKKYVINQGGTSDGLIEEIYKNLVRSDLQDGWNFELSEKYKATFKRIINFLENKKQEYFVAKNSIGVSNYNPIPKIVGEKPVINKPVKKIPEKWYALLYLLELSAINLTPPTTAEGSFIKSEIEKIGMQRIGSKGQSFYRQVLAIYPIINNSSKLVGVFGSNWKDTLFQFFKNDEIKNYIDIKY